MKENATMTILPALPGIYQIVCTANQKIYIGSAINLYRRKLKHWKDLSGGYHGNKHLQSAWNKYGESAFIFTIIETIANVEYLLIREQYWIDKTNCCDNDIGFNINPIAGSMQGYEHTEETKKRIIATSSKTWYGFINPDGEEVVIHGLRDFCRRNGLNHKTMNDISKGKGQTHHRGWTHVNAPKNNVGKIYSGFIRPDGTIEPPFQNMSEFCRKNNLNSSAMIGVYIGRNRYKSHRGWTHVNIVT